MYLLKSFRPYPPYIHGIDRHHYYVVFCIISALMEKLVILYTDVDIVREFLSITVHSFLGRYDFKRVGASLRADNVI